MTAAPATLRRQPARHAHNGNGRVIAPEPIARPVLAEVAAAQEAPEPLPPPARPHRSSWAKGLALVGLAAALVAGGRAGAGYLTYSASHESTDDASLTTDITEVAPQVSARVTQVLVRDNQQVKAGEPLVLLNSADYQAAFDQAQANLDAAIAQNQGAGANVKLTEGTGDAQVTQARGGVQQAEGAIAAARADEARAAAAVASARASASSSRAKIGTALAAIDSAVAGRQTALAKADAALAQVKSAGAAVRASQSQVTTAEAGVQAALAVVRSDLATYGRARRDAQRDLQLLSGGYLGGQQSDQSMTLVHQLQAQIAGERQKVASAEAQVESARQQVAQSESEVASRKGDYQAAQQQVLAATAAIVEARAQVESARQDAEAAGAAVVAARAQQNAAREATRQTEARRRQSLGQLDQALTAPHQVAVSRSAQAQAAAKIEQMRAALETARLQLDYTRIVAPISGRVNKKSVQVGDMAQPGSLLLAIVPDQVWVVANFKETQLVHARKGQAAEVRVDGLPGRTFRAHVDSIAAGTGSTFTLLPPDNATGNFTKIVQRVPVKITFDGDHPDRDRLRAGMSVVATVVTR